MAKSNQINQNEKKTTNKLNLNKLPSENFMNYFLEKSSAFPQKFDKKIIQKEIVNRCRFKTQACNDTNYLTVIEAEKTIDRNDAINQLNKYLDDMYLSLQMEKGLFEFSLTHVTSNKLPNHLVTNIYQHQLTTLCRNLDPNDKGVENKSLIIMIKENGMDPFFVPFLKPEQMHPDRWMQIINKKKIEEETENNLQTTDIYTCKRCKEKKFKIMEMQLRSLDEPSSKFCTCMTCGFTFIK